MKKNRSRLAIIVFSLLLILLYSNAISGEDSPFNFAYALERIAQSAASLKIDEPELETNGEATDIYRQAKLAVVGDLMAHQEQLAAALNNQTGEYDFNYAFRHIANYLQNADLTIGNLETVFAGKDAGYSSYPRFNTPDSYAKAIAAAGFDLLTTANNHSNDKNEPGILRTLDILDQNGIGHVGTYRTAEEREEIKLMSINNITFAFLSYAYGTNGIPLVPGHEYTVNLLDRDLIYGDIQAAKALNPDFIIVLPHMGDEYAEQPSDRYKEWVRFMFEAGADIVLASHPHVLQPVAVERVTDADGRSRLCFAHYSLGNFVSGQRTIPRDEGIILNLYFEKKNDEPARLTNVSFIPTWVQYINSRGTYDVRPLPLYNILKDPPEYYSLRAGDIIRAKAAYSHITEVLLGQAVPFSEAKQEFFINIIE